MKVVNLLLNEEEDDIRNYIITYLIIKLKVSQGCPYGHPNKKLITQCDVNDYSLYTINYTDLQIATNYKYVTFTCPHIVIAIMKLRWSP